MKNKKFQLAPRYEYTIQRYMSKKSWSILYSNLAYY